MIFTKSVAIATENVYISPNGIAFSRNRIGECKNGLTGKVKPAPLEANILHGKGETS